MDEPDTRAPAIELPAAQAARLRHYNALGPNLRRFVELVAGGEHGAGAIRIVRPRFKDPKALAWKYRALPHVKEAIAELQRHARLAFEAKEYRHKQGIYNRANADRTPLAKQEFWQTDPSEWPLELKDCIESVEFKDGVVSKITLSNRNEAARMFSQHMGWISERKELTGKDGAPLNSQPAVVYMIGTEEASKLRTELDEEV